MSIKEKEQIENSNAEYTKLEKYIPKDTKTLVNLNDCDNFNLLLNKYPEFDRDKKADLKSNYNHIKKLKWQENYKIIKQIYLDRIDKIISDNKDENYRIEKRKYNIDWRLAIGLGEISVYETSIKLHHIYGFPFIPASTFKGNIRTWVIKECFNGSEDSALEDDFLTYVFGFPKKSNLHEQNGNVVFFDVNPISFPKIELDIINTHYAHYYQNGMVSPPGDYSNPNLINFLTVKDTTFEFTYSYDCNFSLNTLKNTKFRGNVDEIINDWIDKTLTYQGIGAKTSVGYGYFSLDRKKAKKEEIEKKKFEEETKNMTELQIRMYKLKKITDSTKHNEVMNLFNEYIDKVDGDEKIELAEFIKDCLVSENKWNKKNGAKLNKKIEKICDILNCEI